MPFIYLLTMWKSEIALFFIKRPICWLGPYWQCFMEIDRLINQAVISRVAIAVKKLSRRRRREKRDASTNQSNNFGVSRKRFKPSTPGSRHRSYVWANRNDRIPSRADYSYAVLVLRTMTIFDYSISSYECSKNCASDNNRCTVFQICYCWTGYWYSSHSMRQGLCNGTDRCSSVCPSYRRVGR